MQYLRNINLDTFVIVSFGIKGTDLFITDLGLLEKSTGKIKKRVLNSGCYGYFIDRKFKAENKNAKPGDVVLLYVCAPKSAIVATAIIADIPYLEENINSEFFNTWFAEMNELILLNTSISRHHLREIFPDWGYWKQPRNSVQVKTEYLSELLPLVAKHI